MDVLPTAVSDAAALAQARAWIEAAERVMVLTGAGVSAESGVPTFRDALTGLWARFNPEDLATEAAYREHPRMVWDWYQERRARVSQVQPNPAHLAIAALATRKTVTLVTQNVDGLHQRAGSVGVIELHGNLFANKWLDGCGKCDVATAEPGRPPRCAACGAMLRPGVVWFGERLPVVANYRAEEAANTCDVCLVVGTSGMVYPAAGLPGLAKDHGARVIVVNPEPSVLDETADLVIHQPAGVCLPAMLA
ncbi:NAD-dependent deacylase [Ralstonia pseudosolanacearum]|uniref:SIR2 family NAD-dependent protein deacylase n=1 Tax=Ralstonia pseudosolanacearum TaxID=1310165 RepID=UPI0008D9CA8A|nr:NAD-dependent deacylase [Ralstonia pseudosolanacearum]AZU56286.1 NAD-dependent deacylase [Ralstonia solanacearum]MCK4135891.1 NAD-dependent deacylase [Ralstonia pseudosolanacearum]MDO3528275.1 NAD-dependent deacylase [Ralstonia pseudosolanacearum]MDO3533215.1 NAD-dependent deacylase [Ralstonia pseudosolanacearum]OHV02970.1 NAD-dependent deacylase [Ralstonia solanacearum]